ncbi:MAG: hypothetical protein ACKOAD_02690 [Gammaproteobacteria bacterium]
MNKLFLALILSFGSYLTPIFPVLGSEQIRTLANSLVNAQGEHFFTLLGLAGANQTLLVFALHRILKLASLKKVLLGLGVAAVGTFGFLNFGSHFFS